MLDNLKKYSILLASKSVRRRDLLRLLNLPFSVVGLGGVSEEYPKEMPAEEVPQFLSELKADAFVKYLKDNELLITADTVVICDGKIYGKPADEADARRMLHELSGKSHHVVTGVSITTATHRTSFSTTTVVKFAELSDEVINYYVDNFHPLDKAGAYGIQEWIGCVAVEGIDGSYYNVMGLPVHRLYQELKLF